MTQTLNKPLHGDIYKCQYTGKEVALKDAIFLGCLWHGIKGVYACAPDAMPAFKESRRAFNEMDANCNNCKNFKRLPHEKNHGFLKGQCDIAPPHLLIYNRTKDSFWVHPDDSMNMKCYEAR